MKPLHKERLHAEFPELDDLRLRDMIDIRPFIQVLASPEYV